jgi:hypothetical protein
MTDRILFFLCAFLIFAGSTCAQTPTVVPSAPAPGFTDTRGPTTDSTQSTVVSTVLPDGGLVSEGNGNYWKSPVGNGNFWISGDGMLGWMHGANLPPLATTAPATTPRMNAGVFGQPTTTVLFGNDRVDSDPRPGIRLDTGYWFSSDRTLGIDAGFMVMSGQAAHFSATSNGSTILAMPYTDATDNVRNAVLIAFPGDALGSSAGSITVRDYSAPFYEWHLDLREKSLDLGWFRLDSLFGYRAYSYNEQLHIQSTLNPTSGAIPVGTQFVTTDNFGTRNMFNGLDLGLNPQFVWNNVSLEFLGKIAFGTLNTQEDITGYQVVTSPGSPTIVRNGGLYALPSNIGSYHQDHFWILPEAGATLDWKIRPNIDLRLGYSLLILNGIVRAGDQIDTSLNPNLFPGSPAQTGPNHPTFFLRRSDSYIQSVTLGLQIAY